MSSALVHLFRRLPLLVSSINIVKFYEKRLMLSKWHRYLRYPLFIDYAYYNFKRAQVIFRYDLILAFSLVHLLESAGIKSVTELDKIMQQAEKLLQDGKKNEASDLYKSALPIAIAKEDNDLIFTIKERIAIIAFSCQQFPEAEILLLSAKDKLVKNGIGLDDLRMMFVNLRLAETYDFMNNSNEADKHYKLCSKGVKSRRRTVTTATKEGSNHDFDEYCLLFLVSRANHSLTGGHIDRAHKYFSRAYQFCKQIRGDDKNEECVNILQLLGSVSFQKGDVDDAIGHLQKAIELGKYLPGMVELANAYVLLGNIYLARGQFDAASSLCTQGLKNSLRHRYEKGIQEANACLEQIQKE